MSTVNPGPRYESFRDYVRVIRERRLLVLIVCLVFGVASLLLSVGQDEVYEAESALEFKDENVDTSVLGRLTAPDAVNPEQRAALAAGGFGRLDLAERARRILKAKVTARMLSGAVSAEPEARTNLVIVRVQWEDPRFAARAADAFAQASMQTEIERSRARFREAAASQRRITKALGKSLSNRFARSLSVQQAAQLDQLARIVKPVEVARVAEVPRDPIAPQPIRNTVLGLLLGLTLGLVAAFVRDSLDRRFKSSREITDELKMPLLGFVREDALGRSVVPNGSRALDASELESFRILRTNVEFLDVDNTPKNVLITSALPEEGKSTVSAALACAYASAGKRTMLVECDLRRPSLANRLQLQPGPGLTDYLLGAASPQDVMQTLSVQPATPPRVNGREPTPAPEVPPVVVVTAGSPTPQPAELLRSERCRRFFEDVAGVYDAIIIDTSPLLSVADALELLRVADAVVLCVRASHTTRDQARAARAALEHFPERPRGIVVTGIRKGDAADAYGYYSYGYVYGSKA